MLRQCASPIDVLFSLQLFSVYPKHACKFVAMLYTIMKFVLVVDNGKLRYSLEVIHSLRRYAFN